MKTSTRTIARRDFTDMLEMGGLNEYEIRETYSGRFMDGALCFAVIVEPSAVKAVYFSLGHASGYAEAQAAMDDADDETDQWDALLRAATQDSIARDAVIYFPGWAFSS